MASVARGSRSAWPGSAGPARAERADGAATRSLVVWCPDWPAVAAALSAGGSADGPVAVVHANRVQACTQAARAQGVRTGMRRREAQSRCPELLVLPTDNAAAGRLFEPVVAAVEHLVPGVEVLRPGMVACAARGPRRYFGTEEAAAERIVDAVEALGIEVRIGIADQLDVAVLAARQQRIVPAGGSAEFCAGLPIAELARDPAIAPPERAALTDLLVRLGITTVGAFARLPAERVGTRFGADALVAHRLAAGTGGRGISRRSIPADLTIDTDCDPPLERVDAAAFLGRALAERFHSRLADAGLACTRLAIEAHTRTGHTLHRVWRSARPLSPAATADRLRWQLEGWLAADRAMRSTSGPWRAGGRDDTAADVGAGAGAIVRLRLEPVEAVDAGRVQYGLWGSDGESDHRAGWAFARVQGLLGPEAVLSPVLSGGRLPAERIGLVGWGEQKTAARDPRAPWPGALPAPSPTRLDRPRPVELTDAIGDPVVMTPRGRLSTEPVRLDGRAVTGWAGPWVFDERWWDADDPELLVSAPPRYAARLQVLCEPGAVLLVRYRPGPPAQGSWQLEGSYE